MNTRLRSVLFALTATAASLTAAETSAPAAQPAAPAPAPTHLQAEISSPDAQIRALLDAARATAGREEFQVTLPALAVPASLLNAAAAAAATPATAAEKPAPVRAPLHVAGL